MKTISNPFWLDVLKSLHTLTKTKNNNNMNDVLQTPVFLNEDILIGRKPIFFTNWYKNGVTFINDFVKNNGDFYSLIEFKNKYNIKTNFIQYNGLINAIKELLCKNNVILNKNCTRPIIPPIYSLIVRTKNGCQDMYKILNHNTEQPTSKLKWQQIYVIDELTRDKILLSPFNNKFSVQQQWFQTRINHRILSCKKYLYTLKLIDSPLCTFCYQDETLVHMFWTCSATQTFLNTLRNWLSTKNIDITFQEKSFIFNTNVGNNISSLELHILLEAKHYIFSARRLNRILSVAAFKNIFKHKIEALKEIATKNGKLDSFITQWHMLLNI